MSDKPINNDDAIIKQLEQKIETLKQAEAQKKLEASQPAQVEGQPQPLGQIEGQTPPEVQPQGQIEAQQQPLPPAESNTQTELQKLTGDKQFDTQTQARSRLGLAAPAHTEAGANQRIETGPEGVDKEYWGGGYGIEGG